MEVNISSKVQCSEVEDRGRDRKEMEMEKQRERKGGKVETFQGRVSK